jgi:exodeoxyribonuclease V alpha subunit
MGTTNALVDSINNACQQAVNADGTMLMVQQNGDNVHHEVKLGDPVLFTSNNYQAGYQNGTIGLMTKVNSEVNSEVKGVFGQVTLDNNETVDITTTQCDEMKLAYAITLHKAQGSQFPRIIIALKKSQVVDRSWLYTAITRAEAEVHIVSTSELFKKTIQLQSKANLRKTYLSELLKTVSADAYEKVGITPQVIR